MKQKSWKEPKITPLKLVLILGLIVLGIIAGKYIIQAVSPPSWTDPTITAGQTLIRKIHIDELRSEIDANRADVGLATTTWTDSTITAGQTLIRAVHFTEARTALEGIFTTIGDPLPSWTDATITSGTTIIRKTHLDEVRASTTVAYDSINAKKCCGSYGGSDTGSAGSCPGTDDSACGTIDCSGWYVQTGTEGANPTQFDYCYNKQNITTNRCEEIDDCKDANTADCDPQATSTQQYSCGSCKYIHDTNDCYQTTLGDCTNYANGTSCGTNRECSSGLCTIELDYMEYANDAAAQAAYPTSLAINPNLKLFSKLGAAGEITSPAAGTAGTVIGSPTYPASKFGSGILSDVDNEGCYFPTGANSININKGTIECWVKINFAPTDASYHQVWYFVRWESGYGGIELRFNPNADYFEVFVDKDAAIQVAINSGSFSWSSGTLAHFAVTWDRAGNDIGSGKTLVLKINNIEYGSSITTWDTTTVRNNLWVGFRSAGNLHSDMVIDNLKTYNYCKLGFSDKDEEYSGWGLESYSESGIKQQGSHSLKGIAKLTGALNETLTRTVSPTKDLSDLTTIKFDARASRTGTNLQLRIRDSGSTWSEYNIAISSANAWETKEWDISGISNANKNAIDRIEIKVTDAGADNTFYIDNMYAEG